MLVTVCRIPNRIATVIIVSNSTSRNFIRQHSFTIIPIDLDPVFQVAQPVAVGVVAAVLEVVAPPRLWERPA
eukprot:2309232-Pyramimonas_sp.AAC.1